MWPRPFGSHILPSVPSSKYPFSPFHGTSSSNITRSNSPWTISKPADLLQFMAPILRSLRAPTSASGSLSTTSCISNNFNGNGIFLLDDNVFKRPGNSVVRATWNSNVFGFEMWTAGTSSIFRLNLAATSSREHYRCQPCRRFKCFIWYWTIISFKG